MERVASSSARICGLTSLRAHLHGLDLIGVDLASADLRKADLRGTNLSDAVADWRPSRRRHLSRTILDRADLAGAHLIGAKFLKGRPARRGEESGQLAFRGPEFLPAVLRFHKSRLDPKLSVRNG